MNLSNANKNQKIFALFHKKLKNCFYSFYTLKIKCQQFWEIDLKVLLFLNYLIFYEKNLQNLVEFVSENTFG